MNEIRYRKAKRADVPLILTFIQELAEYEHMSNQVVATPALLEHWLFDQNVAEVLLAETEADSVGFALYFYNFSTFLGRAGLYLEDLYVRPAYRGRGIGKSLMQQLAKTAVARGCGRMEWWCLDWNKPSIDFYKSLDAEAMEDWTVYRLAGESLTQLADENPD